MLILQTERLNLRTVSIDDAAFYLGLLNEPSWIQNIGDRNVRTLEQARQAILDGPVAMQAARGHSLYVVERKDDQVPMGLCGLIKRDTLVDVDIGYAFRPAYWGQGYAHEAAQAVMQYAKDTVGLARLAAITSPENGSSNRLLRKLGFHFEKLTSFDPSGAETNLYGFDFVATRQ
jgi:RimJ/RimL family protein N-acetyltransferase